ncbi:hypothetical protein [Yinghuangia seranimata]|uniref:hypothetical protein n=1 Tax=Yinghuangia seranimata TaxID=408067 RepID=UPI00248D0C16|nr:hypothetical protein [Yinghuangia seranimata]MDI2129343.1 hypothetical protein [Yinghuangia seranimata]
MGLGFPHIPNPIDVVEDVVKDKVVDPIKDHVVDPVVDKVEDAGSWAENNVIDPSVGAVEDAGGWVKDKASWAWDKARDPYDEVKEAVTEGPSKPTFHPNGDLSSYDAPSVKVSLETLQMMSKAARDVADALKPKAGVLRGSTDEVPGQLAGWDAGAALTACVGARSTRHVRSSEPRSPNSGPHSRPPVKKASRSGTTAP